MTLVLPVGPRRMSSWRDHQRRTTPSTEPGTDFYCPIGTPVFAPADGEIWGYGLNLAPATGRWVGVNFDNGMSFRAMHFSRLVRSSGRVKAGELIAYSGASGYGKEDWSSDPSTGGAHVHVTLWPTHDHRYGYRANGTPYTIDFMEYAGGSAAGGGAVPFDPEDFLMALSETQQRQMYEALVVGGPSAQAYYVPQAIVNVIRTEIAPAIAAIAAGGILYPGAPYAAFPAIANAIRAEGGAPALDVNEAELAAALAPALAPLLISNAGTLTDETIAAVAAALADEQARRLAS